VKLQSILGLLESAQDTYRRERKKSGGPPGVDSQADIDYLGEKKRAQHCIHTEAPWSPS
jgi:hypothetical protein